jgi:predicted nucleic acid-binding protein
VPLVDTSVWVAHFKEGNVPLPELLEAGGVICHPFVMGELAGGSLGNRSVILSWMGALPQATVADHEEVLALIGTRKLWGSGLGYVDVHLLASALLTGVRLWTLDRRLGEAAEGLGCRYSAG